MLYIPILVLKLSLILFLNVFRVKGTCGNYTGEFFFVLDNSSSAKDDFPTIAKLAPELVNSLSVEFPNSKFGISLFSDKSNCGGVTGDSCYDLRLPLTTDKDLFVKRLNSMPILYGNDLPEAQLDGLYYAARHNLTGWSEGHRDENNRPILRVIILSTDAAYHVAGDCDMGPVRYEDWNPDLCMALDYPDIITIKQAFMVRNIVPLFLIKSYLEQPRYVKLQNQISDYGYTMPLKSDSSDIIMQLKQGLSDISCQVPNITTTTTTATAMPETQNKTSKTPVIVGAATGTAGIIGAAAALGAKLFYDKEGTSSPESLEVAEVNDVEHAADREMQTAVVAEAFA